jgi:hypothetical protein
MPAGSQNTTLLELIVEVDRQGQRIERFDAAIDQAVDAAPEQLKAIVERRCPTYQASAARVERSDTRVCLRPEWAAFAPTRPGNAGRACALFDDPQRRSPTRSLMRGKQELGVRLNLHIRVDQVIIVRIPGGEGLESVIVNGQI